MFLIQRVKLFPLLFLSLDSICQSRCHGSIPPKVVWVIGDFVSVVHQYHRRRESLDLRGGEWVEVEGEAALSLSVC